MKTYGWKVLIILTFILKAFHGLRYPKLRKTVYMGGLKAMSRVAKTLQALLISMGNPSEVFLVTL